MPEKLTKEELLISKTVDQLRVVKEELVQQASAERIAYDDELELVKVKKPKAKAVKVNNEGSDQNGFGSAGEMFGKSIHPDVIKAFNVGQRQQQAQQNTESE